MIFSQEVVQIFKKLKSPSQKISLSLKMRKVDSDDKRAWNVKAFLSIENPPCSEWAQWKQAG